MKKILFIFSLIIILSTNLSYSERVERERFSFRSNVFVYGSVTVGTNSTDHGPGTVAADRFYGDGAGLINVMPGSTNREVELNAFLGTVFDGSLGHFNNTIGPAASFDYIEGHFNGTVEPYGFFAYYTNAVVLANSTASSAWYSLVDLITSLNSDDCFTKNIGFTPRRWGNYFVSCSITFSSGVNKSYLLAIQHQYYTGGIWDYSRYYGNSFDSIASVSDRKLNVSYIDTPFGPEFTNNVILPVIRIDPYTTTTVSQVIFHGIYLNGAY